MTLDSKMVNANVVSKKIRLKEEAEMTETVIVIQDRLLVRVFEKVTEWKPNVLDGPNITKVKSHV